MLLGLSSLSACWKLKDRAIVCFRPTPLKLPLTLCLAVFGQLHTIDFFACLCYLLLQGHLHSESSSLSILVFFFHRLESGEMQVDFRIFQRRRLLVFLLQGCIYVFFVLCVIFCLHLNLPLLICRRFRAIARAKTAVSHNYDHKKRNVEKDCSVYLRAAFNTIFACSCGVYSRAAFI